MTRRRERNRGLVLAEILKRALPPEARRRIYSIDLIGRRWAKVVGDEIARRSEPEALVDGVLTVRVTDAVWGKTIARLSSRIVPELNRSVGAPLVRRINFTRRERLQGSPDEAPPRRKRGSVPPAPPESVIHAAEIIADPELRALVTASAARYIEAQRERERKRR